MRSFDCILVGGPFDGDEGTVPFITPTLHPWSCAPDCPLAGGDDCPLGGVHWSGHAESVPKGRKAERYELEEGSPDEFGVHRYVFPELTGRRPRAEVEDLVAA